MRVVLLSLILVALAHTGRADEPPFKRLPKSELESLAGDWELKVDTKAGWKGKIVLKAIAVEDKRYQVDYLHWKYTVTVTNGVENFGVPNTPALGIKAQVFAQENEKCLVASTGTIIGLEFYPPTDATKRAKYVLQGDRLTLDVRSSYRTLMATSAITELDLDWSRLEFQRVMK